MKTIPRSRDNSPSGVLAKYFRVGFTVKIIWRGVKTFLMSVLTSYRRTSHSLAAMLRCVVVVNHDGVSDDGSFSAQRKVGVGEELLGGAQINDLPRHVQLSKLGGQ